MIQTRGAAVRLAAALCLAAGCAPSPPQPDQDPPDRAQQRHLLIVLDGLRPDYVTPALMPNLHALGERGVVFTDHHAVYPTVTRVNAASISTGAYPENARADGQRRFLSGGRGNAVPDHERARQPAADRARRGGTAADGADARRTARGCRTPAARGERRLERVVVPAQPPGGRRRHHPLRVRPPGDARPGGSATARSAAVRRDAQPRPQSLHR